MPCTYDETPDLRAEIKRQAQMLCQVCNLLEDWHGEDIIDGVPGLREWWTRHKQLDRQRGDRK